MGVKSVILNDIGKNRDSAVEFYVDADLWAKEHCPSYQEFEMQDVSDVSLVYDLLARYDFEDEEDVVLFTLKWL